LKRIAAALAVLGLGTGALAQPACDRDAMIVFDGSGSMSEVGFNRLREPRIHEARRALRRSIPQVAPFRRLGLIVYGPGANGACSSVDLRFPPIQDAAGRIIAEIDRLSPGGKTPLTDAVLQAAEVLDFRNRPGTIVLVTDGKETCEGQPCQLAARLAAGSRDLTVHVIGFKVRGEHVDRGRSGDDTEAISVASCLAERTGGRYFSAETVDELTAALKQALGCPFLAMR
jgi:Ca-activated chloride channel family protein